jgi:hypothetical protein
MNKRQKIVLQIAVMVIILMGLFPPWRLNVSFNDANTKISGGINCKYSFVISQPALDITGTKGKVYYDLDIMKLLLQWSLVSFTCAGLCITFHKTK